MTAEPSPRPWRAIHARIFDAGEKTVCVCEKDAMHGMADCLIAAFFHEVGHIIDGRRKFCTNHRVTIFERELRAWTFGMEEMHKFGIGTDTKAIDYMMERLSRYAAKEGGDHA